MLVAVDGPASPATGGRLRKQRPGHGLQTPSRSRCSRPRRVVGRSLPGVLAKSANSCLTRVGRRVTWLDN
jgi:hypothetical protein